MQQCVRHAFVAGGLGHGLVHGLGDLLQHLQGLGDTAHPTAKVQQLGLCGVGPGLVPAGFQDRAGVEANVPGIFWLDADAVVDTALKDLHSGHGVSVPGLAYRAIRVAMQYTPRRFYLPLTGAVMARLT